MRYPISVHSRQLAVEVFVSWSRLGCSVLQSSNLLSTCEDFLPCRRRLSHSACLCENLCVLCVEKYIIRSSDGPDLTQRQQRSAQRNAEETRIVRQKYRRECPGIQ